MRCPARFADKADRTGTEIVQLAVILPLLFSLALVAVDFGQFSYTHLAVTNAARAGAAYGIVNRHTVGTRALWEAGVRQAVTDEMAQVPGFEPTKLVVTIQSISEADGMRRVRVQVSYPFRTTIDWSPVLATAELSHTAEFRGIR